MSFTHAVRRALTKLRYPKVDSSGNLLTNGVVPRTGTLTELLAETGTGEGEIAVATDVDAMVRYVGGTPSIYGGLRHTTILQTFDSVPIANSGDKVGVSSSTQSINSLGLVDFTNDQIDILSELTSGGVLFRCRPHIVTLAALTDADTTLTLALKRWTGSAYADLNDLEGNPMEWTVTTDGTGLYSALQEEKVAVNSAVVGEHLAWFCTYDTGNCMLNGARFILDIDY